VPAVSGRTLIAHDLRILWNGASAAFGGARDRLLFLLAAPLVLLMAAQGAASASATIGDMPEPARMLMALIAGFAPNLMIRRRLAHLREESVVAAAALRRGAAAVYATFWNVLPAALAIAVLLGGAETLTRAALLAPPLLLAYGVGTASASGARHARSALQNRLQRRRAAQGGLRRLRLSAAGRRGRIADLLASRTGLPRLTFAANLLAFSALGALVTTGCALLIARGGAPAFAAAAVLLIFVLLLREQAMLLRYLLFLGVGPAGPVLVPIALAAAFSVGAVTAAAVAGTGGIGELAAAAAAALLLFAAAALLRGLHHATKPRRAADLAIQIDFAAFLVAGIVVPWLAPPLLAARLFLLHRHAQALRHIAP
jgi:hypothetical protein